MRNKGFVIFLTLLLTALCIYYLSFTFVSHKVQQKADRWAAQHDRIADEYLDSVWTEPVHSLFGAKYTYKEVKEQELNLGLDLKGGMHITLEVSPQEIIRNMAGRSRDTSLFAALDEAQVRRRAEAGRYTDFFYEAFQRRRGKDKLWSVFSNADNRGTVNQSTSDDQIMDMINKEVDGAIDRAYDIIKNRIDRFGVAQPNIQKIQGTDRIQVELAGVSNPKRVRKLLQGVAKLEFFRVLNIARLNEGLEQLQAYLREVEGEPEAASEAFFEEEEEEEITANDTALEDLLGEGEEEEEAAPDTAASEESEEDTLATETAEGKTDPLSKYFVGIDASAFYIRLQDTAKVNELFSRKEVREFFPKNIKFLYSAKANKNERTGEEVFLLYAIETNRDGKPLLSGDVITNANSHISMDGRGYVVGMSMNAKGSQEWARVTGAVAQDPDENNRRIAIVLDDYVFSAPFVRQQITGGHSQIDGIRSQEEAKDLANILNAGKLPAKMDIVQEALVGPALGAEAIERGLYSILAGLALVIVFMVLYYGVGGIVADIALTVNIFFIFGVLAQFGTSLTLPGIAGIVLTVGMSIDANVLIFERIREELRRGKGNMNAIKDGYDRAFWTIFDANATTLLTAIFLYVFGSGPIRGFAITLIIGIFCSFFAAVYVTRVIIEWFAKRNEDKPLSFSTFISKGMLSGFNWDILGKRKIAYVLSSVVILSGVALIFVNGLNLGVDFKGGRSYIVRFDAEQSASEIRLHLKDHLGDQAPEVKMFNRPDQFRITSSYMIDDESTEADSLVEMTLLAGLDEALPDAGVRIMGSEKVGATIAQDIRDAARSAVIFSLAAIFLYILIRFQRWQFGLGALAALFHDVLVVLSFYAFAGAAGIKYEVDQIFIAAMLTIIGYSINDTVVVFDRVKEYIKENPSSRFITILNNSVNATFSRTFITSATTLLVVIILLAFGGEILAGFAFALLIGVISGTYSSIFVATPLVYDFSNKADIKEKIVQEEKEKKAMKDSGIRAK